MKRSRSSRLRVGAIALLTVFGLLSGGSAYASPYPVPAAPPDRTGGSEGGPAPEGAGRSPAIAAPAGDKQTPHDVAPTAIGNTYIQTYGPVTVPAGWWYNAWAYCPSGMEPISGGAYNSSWGGVDLLASYELTSPEWRRQWQSNVINNSAQDVSLTVYAVCKSGPQVYEQFTAAAAPGHDAAAVVLCSGDSPVIGGAAWVGFSGTVDSHLHTIGHMEPHGSTGWRVQAHNNNQETAYVQAVAACGGGIENHQVVFTPQYVEIPKGGYASASVTCPAGKTAFGGGFDSRAGTVTGTDSYPSGNGWTVYARSDVQDDAIRAYLICGN